MNSVYIPGSSAAPKTSFDSKSFSEGPINLGRKTKKYISKKVDLEAEKFSFQDFAPKTSLSPMEVTLEAFPYGSDLKADPGKLVTRRSQRLLGVRRRPIAQNDRLVELQNQFAISRFFRSCQFAYSNF